MKQDLIEKLIERLLDGEQKPSELINIDQLFMGKYCVIRSHNAGVFVGKLLKKQGQSVLLADAIRIHRWSGACSLSQLALEGVKKPEDCKFALPLQKIVIEQVVEVIPCTDFAVKNIKDVPVWKI